jgi:hypothetical protein
MYFVGIALATVVVPLIESHLILNIPQVWGISDGISLEQPLDISVENWMCAGKAPENNGVFNFVAGRTYQFNTVCGEKNPNAPGCLIGDWHTGTMQNDYSGCGLSVSYSNYRNPANHKYISYSRECPKSNTPTSFTISENVENCENCICSWGWAPSRMHSSPGQFYHNCFYCSITGGRGSQSTMKQFDFFNVRGAQHFDLTYNDINPRLTNIPRVSNPRVSNPRVSNPRVSNPRVSNPRVSEPPVSESPVSESPVSESLKKCKSKNSYYYGSKSKYDSKKSVTKESGYYDGSKSIEKDSSYYDSKKSNYDSKKYNSDGSKSVEKDLITTDISKFISSGISEEDISKFISSGISEEDISKFISSGISEEDLNKLKNLLNEMNLL